MKILTCTKRYTDQINIYFKLQHIWFWEISKDIFVPSSSSSSTMRAQYLCLLACSSLSWLLACLLGWLVGCSLAWLIGRLVGWLFAYSLPRLLARSLTCLLAFWFALLAFYDLLCLVDLRSLRGWTPETQPNDAYGVVWLSFWCSTYLLSLGLAWLARLVLDLLDLLLASLGFILLHFACLTCLICVVWLRVLPSTLGSFCLLAFLALLCLLA